MGGGKRNGNGCERQKVVITALLFIHKVMIGATFNSKGGV